MSKLDMVKEELVRLEEIKVRLEVMKEFLLVERKMKFRND